MRPAASLALLAGLVLALAAQSPYASPRPARPPARDSGYVRVGGGRLFFRSAGQGYGLGGGVDGRIWEGQAAALEGCYRVVRYDARGFGRSDLPAGRTRIGATWSGFWPHCTSSGSRWWDYREAAGSRSMRWRRDPTCSTGWS